eukprot:8317092-Ditylum_brightwellii.AAC.1
MPAGLNFVVAPRLALGAPGTPETIFNTTNGAVFERGMFPSKEVGLGGKLLASANLGAGAI